MTYQKWLFVAAGLFALGMALGLTMPANISNMATQDLAPLKELGKILQPFKISTAIFIFFKNVFTLFFSFLLSPFLCLLPIMALTFNGWLLSFVAATVVKEKSLLFLLAAILPHGIFELPGIIIGEAAALSFGALAMLALISKGKRSQLRPNLRQSLKYLFFACIFLLPAAIIETYITPLFFS